MEFAELIKTTKVDGVLFSHPGLGPVAGGTLCVTSHHLLLSGGPERDRVELWLLIRNVDAVEKRLANASCSLTLKCKDLKVLHLEIPGMEECLNVAGSIEALSSVESVMMMYPFFYRPQSMSLAGGGRPHAIEKYYWQVVSHTGAWRLSGVNGDFEACPSYPALVAVPSSVDDAALKKSARFRQGRRFPVLSYYHKKNGTVMLRSSQPLVGTHRKRCQEDEGLLAAALGGGGRRGFVLDTRSSQAAKQAKMAGGGTERRSAYAGWKRLHRALDRGRPLQESFAKVVETCNDPSLTMDRWLSKLEASKWLAHVKEALGAACLAAQCMEREDACVLVHGAEGTDATLLVTALAQVILDPGRRTMAGFQELLEQEWIQGGHPFQLRCARSAYSHARLKQESPVFLLFLDCVWQLGRQFPFSLEFDEAFLLALFEHSYASPYGTFLCNNEKERKLCDVEGKTHSLWPWIHSKREMFLNPLFAPNPLVIWPSVEPQSILLWQGLFLRWVRPSHYIDEAWTEIQEIARNHKAYHPEHRSGAASTQTKAQTLPEAEAKAHL